MNATAAVGISGVPGVICSVNRALLDSPVCLSSTHREACVAGSPSAPGDGISAGREGKPGKRKTQFIINIDVSSNGAVSGVLQNHRSLALCSLHAARGTGKP